jgi:hypothetical protein
MNTDRRKIEPLLAEYFPSFKGASSDEWGAFLDVMTGISTDRDTPNGVAFDAWRLALADMGFPVFKWTPEKAAEIKRKTDTLLEREQKRAADLGTTLAELAKAAPNWPVAEVLAKTKGD